MISSIVISFLVSVPVLSVAITLTAPKVSTDGRDFMMAFCFVIFPTPIAKTTDVLAGSPSGKEPTIMVIKAITKTGNE